MVRSAGRAGSSLVARTRLYSWPSPALSDRALNIARPARVGGGGGSYDHFAPPARPEGPQSQAWPFRSISYHKVPLASGQLAFCATGSVHGAVTLLPEAFLSMRGGPPRLTPIPRPTPVSLVPPTPIPLPAPPISLPAPLPPSPLISPPSPLTLPAPVSFPVTLSSPVSLTPLPLPPPTPLPLSPPALLPLPAPLLTPSPLPIPLSTPLPLLPLHLPHPLPHLPCAHADPRQVLFQLPLPRAQRPASPPRRLQVAVCPRQAHPVPARQRPQQRQPPAFPLVPITIDGVTLTAPTTPTDPTGRTPAPNPRPCLHRELFRIQKQHVCVRARPRPLPEHAESVGGELKAAVTSQLLAGSQEVPRGEHWHCGRAGGACGTDR